MSHSARLLESLTWVISSSIKSAFYPFSSVPTSTFTELCGFFNLYACSKAESFVPIPTSLYLTVGHPVDRTGFFRLPGFSRPLTMNVCTHSKLRARTKPDCIVVTLDRLPAQLA